MGGPKDWENPNSPVENNYITSPVESTFSGL